MVEVKYSTVINKPSLNPKMWKKGTDMGRRYLQFKYKGISLNGLLNGPYKAHGLK